MAQGRMASLASELQASRESHVIVIETKDAMMRSLVQQNTQLIKEVCYAFMYVFYPICII